MIFRQTHFEPTTACITGQASVAWVDHWFQVGWEQDPVPYNSGKKCKDRIWGDPMNLSGRNICNYVHKYIYIIMYYYYCYYYNIYMCITMQIPIKYMTIRISAIHGRGENNLRPFSNNHGHLDGQSVLGPLDKLCVYI
jgi:hypothetical protein